MKLRNRILPLDLLEHTQKKAVGPPSWICKRLREECTFLDRLDVERVERGDPKFGKTFEERIIWRELLDLELQAVDERISEAADLLEHPFPQPPGT
jgi:hypothetical protein